MKLVALYLPRLLLLVLVSCPSVGAAGILVGDAVVSPVPTSPEPLLKQSLYLTQSIPAGAGLFGIDINRLPVQNIFEIHYEFDAISIAEEIALYAAEEGMYFGPEYASSNEPLVSNASGRSHTYIDAFRYQESKYYAYWDDRNFNSLKDLGDNYGWVQIALVDVGLFQRVGLVSPASATSVGNGIVVGSFTSIPEPSSFSLIVLGILAMRHLRLSRC